MRPLLCLFALRYGNVCIGLAREVLIPGLPQPILKALDVPRDVPIGMHRVLLQTAIDELLAFGLVVFWVRPQLDGDLLVLRDALDGIEIGHAKDDIGRSAHARAHVVSVSSSDNRDAAVQTILRGSMSIVGMGVDHDVAKVLRPHLMVKRIGLPRQEVDAIIEVVGIALLLSKPIDEIAKIGHSLRGILQQTQYGVGCRPQYVEPASHCFGIVLEKLVHIAIHKGHVLWAQILPG
mmetsp:Transcript_17706/g.41799  ORF Transcript_17706/g.41799 Transcript_17706/m.41799 type:complete len:235 (-) Transcript_17706:66-770(-)